jgi:three-Cys-motif partner protein
MSKKDVSDYIKEFIDRAKELEGCSEFFNEYGSDFWSFKKLIFLAHYIRPFLDISIKNNYQPIYIDACAGCGINSIKKENVAVKFIGSPLISIIYGIHHIKKRNENNKFLKWFFVEKEDYYIELEKRIDALSKNIEMENNIKIENGKDVEILHGNFNDKIDEIINYINDNYKNKISVLVFVDPYSFSEIDWNTIEKLYDKLKAVDLIYCFSSGTLKRALDSCSDEKLKKVLPPSLKDKSRGELSLMPEEAFEEAFAEDIVNAARRSITYFGKGITTRNRVNTELYRIMFFTHLKQIAVKNITERICDDLNPLTAKELETITECVIGKAKNLKQFI